ncbi:MAG: hypothetical protein AAGG53_04095 [Cyanobacteria bacterium P01_H01_bin.152]
MVATHHTPEMEQRSDRLAEPAFPLADHGEFLAPGLTKREWFAAMALQGLLAAETENYHCPPKQTAQMAVERADFLIAALNPAPEPEINDIP